MLGSLLKVKLREYDEISRYYERGDDENLRESMGDGLVEGELTASTKHRKHSQASSANSQPPTFPDQK